jgi:hypothetical protein
MSETTKEPKPWGYLVPVQSSNIAAVGYNEEERTLRIQFKSGATYEYEGVELETYDALMGADSVGSAFHRLIKSGSYSYRRVGGS